MAHQARKRFGQHFLTDSAIIDAIVRAIDPRPGEPVVEIGPGLGALTLPLVARFEAMMAVAFSQRRKLLRHSLGRWLDEQGFTGTFDLQRRAEEVPVAEFVALATALG